MISSQNQDKRVAIVGGGFGGCSIAYFLRHFAGNAVGIKIFEKSDRLGGRVRSIGAKEGTELYESGGAIFTGNDRYMITFVKQFGLKAQTHPPSDGVLSLYSGRLRGAAFSSDAGPLYINRLRFALRYGFSLIRFRKAIADHVETFNKIYDAQKARKAYDSPLSMLSDLSADFRDMLTKKFDYWLHWRLRLSQRFRQEFVYGMVSNCYCSGLDIHAFAGMTVASGFGTKLYSIVGGNEQLAQKLSEAALKDNPPGLPREPHLNTTVTQIAPGSKRRYRLTYKEERVEKSEEFDFVVLAFPIHDKAPELPQTSVKMPHQKYLEVDFTHFRGELDYEEFGVPSRSVREGGSTGVTVLPTEPGYEKTPSTLFKYLGRAWSTAPRQDAGPVGCWSAFSVPSRCPSPDKQLIAAYTTDGGLANGLINSAHWFAYPTFEVVREEELENIYGKFALADSLIYANGMENLASNMEMTIIGGCNAALLIANSDEMKSQWK